MCKYVNKSGVSKSKYIPVWLPKKQVWQFVSKTATKYIFPTGCKYILRFFLKSKKEKLEMTLPKPHSTHSHT